MSTILDALKKVQERLDSATKQGTTEGLVSNLDVSAMQDDMPKPSASPDDESEIMEAYLGLMDMIVHIRNHVKEVVAEERAAASESIETLNREIVSLQSRLAQETESHQRELLDRDRELAARNRAFAEDRSRIKDLKRQLAESNAAVVEARSRIGLILEKTTDLFEKAGAFQEASR